MKYLNTFIRTSYKVVFLLATISLLIGGSGIATAFPLFKKESVASAQFESTRHDFGNIYVDEGPVRCDFWFVNIGQQKLIIKQIQASCGCTEVTVSQKQFESDKAGVIKVKMDILGRTGKIKESIVVHTNDPKQPEIFLGIEGFVKRAVTLIPDTIVLGPVYPGTIDTQKLKVVFDPSEKHASISQITCNLPSIKIKPNDSEVFQIPIHEYMYDISVVGSGPAFQDKGEITIQTTHSRAKSLKVPVTIKNMGNLIITPRCVFLGSVKPNQEIVRLVKVTSFDGKPFDLSSILVKGPWKLTNRVVSASADNSAYLLKLRFRCASELPSSFLRGILVLTSNQEDCSTIKLPITAFRQKKNCQVLNQRVSYYEH